MTDAYETALQTFSEARRTGDLLFCSGQIGIEADGAVPADPGRQFGLAFAALAEVLARNGCGPADVVDLTTFHVAYPANMEAFMAQKAAFLGNAKPCWTAVGVAALGHPASLVELKAIAQLSQAKSALIGAAL